MIDFEFAPMPRASEASLTKGPSPEEILSGLNPEQRRAAEITEGPLMVLAGAGSGKTKMLTARIALLIRAKQVEPRNILAVTFTNKAALEMKERVGRFLGTQIATPPWRLGTANVPEIGTFHAVCLKILRREMAYTPYNKPFVIFDDSDQHGLIKRLLERLDIDPKVYSPNAFQAAINRAKCDGYGPEDLPLSPTPFSRKLGELYPLYQQELFENQALDFGEILCMTHRVLRDQPAVLKNYQQEFQYIHVDEYQDTNRIQYLLLELLAGRAHGGHENICVVGDEDQSIYKWRGADIRNILEFEKDFPGAQIVKLEQNYRSTKRIIEAASDLISHNTTRKPKRLWTDNEIGEPIHRIQVADERAEAELVVGEVARLAQDQGYALDDFAIFYRTHAQSRQFEDILRREKIPYQIYGGLRFYDRKEIKDVLAYFRVILNPQDGVSLRRILNVPGRGIGKTTVDKIESLVGMESTPNFWTALQKTAQDPARAGRKIGEFVRLIEDLIELASKAPITELYHTLLERTGYVADLKKDGTPEAQARVENLEEFDNLMTEFVELQPSEDLKFQQLQMFLEQVSLEPAQGKGDPTSVRMMTLHSSKGLEFPVVFMVGMEDGLFPSVRSWEVADDEEIEEERRLCYVGMTRSKKRLYMLGCAMRRIWGTIHFQEPSRFFREIPDDHMIVTDLARRTSSVSSRGAGTSSGYSNADQHINPAQSPLIGRSMRHPEYGRGKIVSVEGLGPTSKIVVEFPPTPSEPGETRKFVYRYVQAYIGSS